MSSSTAKVVSLHLSPTQREPNVEVDSAEFVAGKGVEGDRHADGRDDRSGYQVLIIDKETLDELGIAPGVVREQVTTEGIDIVGLKAGQVIAIGDTAEIEVSQPAEPCSRMEEIEPGMQKKLVGRRGMLAAVKSSGTVKVGDSIRVTTEAAT